MLSECLPLWTYAKKYLPAAPTAVAGLRSPTRVKNIIPFHGHNRPVKLSYAFFFLVVPYGCQPT